MTISDKKSRAAWTGQFEEDRNAYSNLRLRAYRLEIAREHFQAMAA
jgi:hypothetical protein